MKPRGRPRQPGPVPPSVDLHFRLPAKHYDEAYTLARRDRLTVPEWIRQAIRDKLRQKLDP